MSASLDVLLSDPIGTIKPNIYGHFIEHLGACVYDGLWLNNGLCSDVIEALKPLRPPVLRWPGGCFADDYHWQDGIGPRESRPKRVNLHWGGVIESNHFGTHEFIAFCRALGAQPYISGNVGSGSPREMRDWVEYCNHPCGSRLSDLRRANGSEQPFNVQFWGVGNEPWGCGGHFTPQDYAKEYRRFATYLRGFGETPLYLIAAGPDGNDLEWTHCFFDQLKNYPVFNRIHGFAAHYYCGTAGTATEYTEEQWYELLHRAAKIEERISRHRDLMDEFDPQRKIGLIIDEWGTWHPPTPGRNPAFLWQQNTLRDALVAAITLNIFNCHADKVAMANIAQAVNVLQALLLTENGKVIRTPTYHVYDLYKNHQSARAIRLESNSDLNVSASLKNTTLTITAVNTKIGRPIEMQINLRGASAILVRQTILTDSDIHAHNTFAEPTRLVPQEPRVLPLRGDSFTYTFPAQSLTRLEMSLA